MKCLVTGGAGFIGSHIVGRLLELGHRVTVIDNLSTGDKTNVSLYQKNKNFRFVKKSILDNLTSLFNKSSFDVVFHLAALPRVQFSIAEPEKTHLNNIDATFRLLNYCRLFKVKRFIFSSSSSVYGDQKTLPLVESMPPNPMSPYALHKYVGEEYCRLFYKFYGLEAISLRYFNVYGPRQNPSGGYANLIPKFFKSALENKAPTINGNGRQTRDFTYIDDVINANVLASITKNKAAFGDIFNIGAGERISVNEVANTIFSLCHSTVKPIHGPKVIEPLNTLANTNKARKVLGWQPQTKFKKGIALAYAYFQKKSL